MKSYIDEKTGETIYYAGEKTPHWIVTNVKPQDDYILLVTFIGGENKVYDMKPLIERGKVFAPLKDAKIFKQAYIDGSTVAWSDKIDIAPEELYENSVEVVA